MTNTGRIRIVVTWLILSSFILAMVLAGPVIYPSLDTVDARRLRPGALVLLEPSAPMALNTNDLVIYSGAINEGNQSKQKLLLSTSRIFYWETEHYLPCTVLSVGPYGICHLQNGITKKTAYSSAAFLHRAMLSQ
jgi:hypothetical protein